MRLFNATFRMANRRCAVYGQVEDPSETFVSVGSWDPSVDLLCFKVRRIGAAIVERPRIPGVSIRDEARIYDAAEEWLARRLLSARRDEAGLEAKGLARLADVECWRLRRYEETRTQELSDDEMKRIWEALDLFDELCRATKERAGRWEDRWERTTGCGTSATRA